MDKRTVYKDGFFKPADSQFWHYVIEVSGHRKKLSARTGNLRDAKKHREAERAKLRSAGPVRRERGQGSLAELGAKDVLRAKAEGSGKKQQDALVYVWKKICGYWGPHAHPRVITFDSTTRLLADLRLVISIDKQGKEKRAGLAGQSLVRIVHALQRGTDKAVELGWITQAPRKWPAVASDPKKRDQAGRLHPPEILARWIQAIAEDKARDVARLYLVAGLRQGEMARVSPAWVHPLPSPLVIGGVTFVAVLRAPDGATKNRKEREMLIDAASADAIARHGNMRGRFLKSWRTAHKAIGYNQRISPRDLRHCCRTYGGTGSGDQQTAQHVLGHSNQRISAQYDHMFAQRLGGFAAAVHGAVFGAPAEVAIHPSKSTPVPEDAVNDGRTVDRTRDILRVKQGEDVLTHVSGCIHCRRHAVRHIESQRIAWGSHPSNPPQDVELVREASS